MKIYNTCVRSVLYGCESWPVKESDLSSLQSFENRCLRRILHKGHDLPNSLITPTAKCDPLAPTIQKRRLKWLRHALRMKSSEISNAVVEFEKGENWRRPPCGVREKPKKVIKPPKMTLKKWEAQWFDLCKETAQNRSQWRALIPDLNVAG